LKFAESLCRSCGVEFKITFEKDIPPIILTCPICGFDRCKYIRIDENEQEY